MSTLWIVNPGRQRDIDLDADAPSKTDPEVGRLIAGRYRLVRPLGTGASATVYLAQDVSLQRQVAVKLLHPGLVGDPKFRRRFEAEARSAAQMSHPHLMAVHDWGDDGEAYLVTELLPGGSLRQMIDEGLYLSPSQALIVGLHAAEGLAHAHERGFVHRDIKPANLLFGQDGRLRIADFGIARAVAEAAWTEPEGSLIGTARYAAPEQAAGRNVDGRADVYSLALTLTEAVTGVVPLVEATPLATMLIRQDQDVPRIDELGPLADAMVAAGQVDPELRPSSAEFVQLLNAAAGSLPRPKRLPLVGGLSELDGTTGVVDLRDRTSGAKPTNNAGLATSGSALEATRQHDAVVIDEAVIDGPVVDVADQEDPLEFEPGGKLRNRQWPWLVMVLVLVLSGFAIVRYATGKSEADNGVDAEADTTSSTLVTRPVGTFVGGTVEDAERDLELAKFVVTLFGRAEDGTVVGEILEQSPAPGVLLEEGSEVTLWVSEGPVLRGVPPLVGLTLAEANALLVENHLLVGSVGNEFDEVVARGSVIAVSVEAGAELETGSRVDLVLSDGPQKRVVPELGGLTVEAAKTALATAGLVYAEADEGAFSESVAEGNVVSADQLAGASVDRDSTITVTLSRGLPFVTIPNVKGMTGAKATTVLEEAGFTVSGTSGSPNSEVIETSPPIGETHRKGTSIFILVR